MFPLTHKFNLFVAAALCLIASSTTAIADDWQIAITVDNRYDIYFGDAALSVPTFVGTDATWANTETYNVLGVAPSAFLYVATASDHSAYQGFLGEFINLTTVDTLLTSDDPGTRWEVFPAGAHLPALNAIDGTIPVGVWPSSTQPTVTQVQTAVQYATTNSLWQTPDALPGWDNSVGAPSIWGVRPGIPAAAEWIWHDTGNHAHSLAPLRGFNHDEFLIFRIAGNPVPEPSAWVLMGVMFLGIATLHRRFSYQHTLREAHTQ